MQYTVILRLHAVITSVAPYSQVRIVFNETLCEHEVPTFPVIIRYILTPLVSALLLDHSET